MCITSTASYHQPVDKMLENSKIIYLMLQIKVTFFLSSSLRSKAHFCLHCSQVTGGPYFFSELVQRWHLLPMKAAMMLQYSQAEGFPYCLTLNSHFLQIVLVFPLLGQFISVTSVVEEWCRNRKNILTFPAGTRICNRCIWRLGKRLCIPVGKWKTRQEGENPIRATCHWQVWHVQEVKTSLHNTHLAQLLTLW